MEAKHIEWKPTTLEMELALSEHFNLRANLIVPNVYWSFFRHEVDLLVLSPRGYAWEIEIKVSLPDLRKDTEKRHNHRDPKIKFLWFAIPEHLKDSIDLIPEHAGIVIVRRKTGKSGNYFYQCRRKRHAKQTGNYRFSEKQRQCLMRLAAMRVWTLKRQLQRAEKEKNGRNSNCKTVPN